MIIKQEIVAEHKESTDTAIKVAGVPMRLLVRDAWDGGSTADEPGVWLRQTWLSPVTPVKYWVRENQP